MEQTAPEIRQLDSSTQLLEGGRLQLPLEGPRRVLFPTVQHDSVLLVETDGGGSGSSSSHPVLAEPTLVPGGPRPRRGRSAPFAPLSGPVNISYRGDPPTSRERFDSADRLEVIRRRLSKNGVSDVASSLILSATRRNTNAAYQSAWNSWGNWCSSWEIDPLSPSRADIANFLAEYSVGRKYRTVNVARSMLSSTLATKLGKQSVGKDPLVISLLKGLYNNSPPAARYSKTWDPDLVLAHLDITAGAPLSLLELSRKLVTLVALCSLLRTCEISSILFDSIEISDSRVSFTLGKPRKGQHEGPLHRLSIEAYSPNVSICPVKCMEEYLDRTAGLRVSSTSSSLLLSSNKPHGPASVASVGRWIKEQLSAAGIDTSVFCAHSTRGAASSKAAAAGVPIQSILDTGHWARESTFARFYKREVADGPSNLVANAVLRPSSSISEQ